VLRLFILDRAKAVRAAIGRRAPIQCCQVHKGRNIAKHCPKKHVAACAGPCARRGSQTTTPKPSD